MAELASISWAYLLTEIAGLTSLGLLAYFDIRASKELHETKRKTYERIGLRCLVALAIFDTAAFGFGYWKDSLLDARYEKASAQIKVLSAPRSLDDQQITALVRSLKASPGQHIEIVNSLKDSEAASYAAAFSHAFQEAGWVVATGTVKYEKHGVWILYPYEQDGDSAMTIASAFNRAGIQTDQGMNDEYQLSKGSFVLVVGKK